jgi:hypothetical protein
MELRDEKAALDAALARGAADQRRFDSVVEGSRDMASALGRKDDEIQKLRQEQQLLRDELAASALASAVPAPVPLPQTAVEYTWTPLHEALNRRNAGDAEAILRGQQGKMYCNSVAPDDHLTVPGSTVLHIAAHRGVQTSLFALALVTACDPPSGFASALLERLDRNQKTALVLACSVGNAYSEGGIPKHSHPSTTTPTPRPPPPSPPPTSIPIHHPPISPLYTYISPPPRRPTHRTHHPFTPQASHPPSPPPIHTRTTTSTPSLPSGA